MRQQRVDGHRPERLRALGDVAVDVWLRHQDEGGVRSGVGRVERVELVGVSRPCSPAVFPARLQNPQKCRPRGHAHVVRLLLAHRQRRHAVRDHRAVPVDVLLVPLKVELGRRLDHVAMVGGVAVPTTGRTNQTTRLLWTASTDACSSMSTTSLGFPPAQAALPRRPGVCLSATRTANATTRNQLQPIHRSHHN